MACFQIGSLNDLEKLSSLMLEAMRKSSFPMLLISGEMGAGKTTFVSHIVSLLPNGKNCEVASPSFNICNIYPCQPQIRHWDLYRCRSNVPDELLESMENLNNWDIIEWANFLNPSDRPFNFLDIHIELNKNMRLFHVKGFGESGKLCASFLRNGNIEIS